MSIRQRGTGHPTPFTDGQLVYIPATVVRWIKARAMVEVAVSDLDGRPHVMTVFLEHVRGADAQREPMPVTWEEM